MRSQGLLGVLRNVTFAMDSPNSAAKKTPVAPHLLYLSDMVPGVPGGGEVMVYRHLRGLVQQGWRVTVSAPAVALRPLPLEHGFEIRPLPSRAWWWPPANPRWPLSKRLRAHLWYQSMRPNSAWSKDRPDCVLSVLWGYSTLTAVKLADYWDIPLAVWVHDLFREMDLPPRQAQDLEKLTTLTLGKADRVWTVSQELAADFTPRCRPGVVRALTSVPEQGVEPAGGFILITFPIWRRWPGRPPNLEGVCWS
jgi:hypothetical protein